MLGETHSLMLHLRSIPGALPCCPLSVCFFAQSGVTNGERPRLPGDEGGWERTRPAAERERPEFRVPSPGARIPNAPREPVTPAISPDGCGTGGTAGSCSVSSRHEPPVLGL